MLIGRISNLNAPKYTEYMYIKHEIKELPVQISQQKDSYKLFSV